jgi:hypothetical protein
VNLASLKWVVDQRILSHDSFTTQFEHCSGQGLRVSENMSASSSLLCHNQWVQKRQLRLLRMSNLDDVVQNVRYLAFECFDRKLIAGFQ